MEEAIIIPNANLQLEGRFDAHSDSSKAVVITHPHPLYGGNMDNGVVCQIASAFQNAGYSTLRFNFRGRGLSSGAFDDGKGEQSDVRAALTWLSDKGYTQITLAGYSFGSWVNAHVVSDGIEVADHIMVSPPAAFISFDSVKNLPCTGLIVTGQNDEIAPPDMIESLIVKWDISPRMEILAHGDHFYSATMNQLFDALSDYLS